jgi:hypothetical protein
MVRLGSDKDAAMTKDEILEYRSNGIPEDVLVFMEEIARTASLLDRRPYDSINLREKLHRILIAAEERTAHYYLKRQKDFGIHNMRLKRLLDSFPAIFKSFDFPR